MRLYSQLMAVAAVAPILLACSAASHSSDQRLQSSKGLSKGLSNMNGEYLIGNPNTDAPKEFSTDYSKYPEVEYFDVYSPPVTSRYAEVFWTMMDEVPLSKELVSRFDNKVMAVVGYEVDQVTGSGEGEMSVPLTWAYNHHYIAYLKGKLGEIRLVRPRDHIRNSHGAVKHYHVFRREDVPDPRPASSIPTSQFFSEGNGGEFRKSFHGYPRGTAQLIESPVAFAIEPMQIDTKNRDYNGTDFQAGPLPRISPAPPNSPYSGLLECPCATRIPFNISTSFNTMTNGVCETPVATANSCREAADKIGLTVLSFEEIASTEKPAGCFSETTSGAGHNLYFNSNASAVVCKPTEVLVGSLVVKPAQVVMQVRLNTTANTATITLATPVTSGWFAVGFDTPNFVMGDTPYTIVVEGARGAVREVRLGNHHPGRQLQASLRVVEDSVEEGIRRVVIERPLKGLTSDHFTFDPTANSLPCIAASGSTPILSYHGADTKSGGVIRFESLVEPTCLCQGETTGTINNIPFHKNCLPEPKSELLAQRNPTCFIQLYQGGQSCCHHKVVLLDTDQVQPPGEMTYRLKFRFWFQEYNSSSSSQPSHENLLRMYWQTEAWSSEYDVVACDRTTTAPEACVQVLRSNFTVRDMMPSPDCSLRHSPTCWGPTDGHDGIELLYVAGHCHAPSCLSMELYNADTGELLCRHEPVYGTGQHGQFDELGYLAIPPCLFGPEEEGLWPPTFLSYDTKLFSIKKNNNTVAHFGEMASWQMRGVLAHSNNV